MIIFIHIPKTAGTSIFDWLTKATGRKLSWYSKENTPEMFFRDPENRKRFLAYGGHFDYGQVKPYLAPDDFVFSVVREPVELAASHYNQIAVRDGKHPLHQVTVGKTLIEAAKDDKKLFGELSNNQCWYLSRQREFAKAWPIIEEYKPNLYTMRQLDQLTRDISKFLGIAGVPDLPSFNVSQADYFDRLSREEIDFLRQINHEDALLYVKAGGSGVDSEAEKVFSTDKRFVYLGTGTKQSGPYRVLLADSSVFDGVDGSYMATANCLGRDFKHPRYKQFCSRISRPPVLHRKYWEFAFIAHHLEAKGALRQGAKGVGFGVGTEPLPSYFASMGCEVLATDAPPGRASEGWALTNQQSKSRDELFFSEIVAEHMFKQNVTFSFADMNAIDDSIRDFDFCWSSCCFEHLGSIEKGLDFVEASVETSAGLRAVSSTSAPSRRGLILSRRVLRKH
jgi:hypothetical protein